MTVLFRYVRPVEFVPKRFGEFRTSLYGGICFRLESLDVAQRVSFSICHPKDLFDKDVARRIATERAERRLGWVLSRKALTPEQIMLELATIQEPNPNQTDWVQFYKHQDLRVLQSRYNEILNQNSKVKSAFALNEDVLSALHLRRSYETRSR